jgi:hypothetical protein
MTEDFKVTARMSVEWQVVALTLEGTFCLIRLEFIHRHGFILLPRLIFWPPQRPDDDHLTAALLCFCFWFRAE